MALARRTRFADRVPRAHALTGLTLFADLGFSAFTRPLLGAALRTSADIYIAHYPAALPAAAIAARRNGAIYAYDAEDFHPGDWPNDPAYDAERRSLRRIEGRYLPFSAYVSAAAPGIAEAYADALLASRVLTWSSTRSRLAKLPEVPPLEELSSLGPRSIGSLKLSAPIAG